MGFYSIILRKINYSLIRRIMVICMVVISCALILQVTSRFIFHQQVAWADELARYLLVWMVFLGSGIAIQNSDLLGIEAVANIVPRKINRIFSIISYFVQVAYLSVAVYYGLKFSLIMVNQMSPLLPIPMLFAYGCIPVGFGFALFNLIEVIYMDLFFKE